MIFTGEHEHTIDSKHRLAIPAEIRTRMEREQLDPAFYVVPGPSGSLWLWLERTFEQLSESLEPTLVPGEDMMEFDEITFPLARRVELDSAGRIRLDPDMLAEAGLGSTVVVLGMRDHLELRDPEQWRRDRAAKRVKQTQIMLRARDSMLRRQRGGGGERSS